MARQTNKRECAGEESDSVRSFDGQVLLLLLLLGRIQFLKSAPSAKSKSKLFVLRQCHAIARLGSSSSSPTACLLHRRQLLINWKCFHRYYQWFSNFVFTCILFFHFFAKSTNIFRLRGDLRFASSDSAAGRDIKQEQPMMISQTDRQTDNVQMGSQLMVECSLRERESGKLWKNRKKASTRTGFAFSNRQSGLAKDRYILPLATLIADLIWVIKIITWTCIRYCLFHKVQATQASN